MISLRLKYYYKYLGKQIYRQRGQEFNGSFHRTQLARQGYSLSTARVAAAAISYALDIALNPKATTEEVARRIIRRFSQ